MYVVENYELLLLPVLDEEGDDDPSVSANNSVASNSVASNSGASLSARRPASATVTISGSEELESGELESEDLDLEDQELDPEQIFAELSASMTSPASPDDHLAGDSSSDSSATKHDLVVTFSHTEWPQAISSSSPSPASPSPPSSSLAPCLDAELKQLSDLLKHPKSLPSTLTDPDFSPETDNVLLVNCPANGRIEQVLFINFPDEVRPLLAGINSLILACLSEQGIRWEQTVPM